MKRCLTLIVAILLIATISMPSQAASNSAYTTFHDNNIGILTPSSFEQLFISENSTNGNTKQFSTFSFIDYSYTFTESAEETPHAHVTLNIQLTINAIPYSFTLSGPVYPYVLESEDTLWEGMLEGSSIVNNKDCVLLASFIRLNNCPDIQVSLTIHHNDTNNELGIIALSFGADILTSKMYDELQSASLYSSSLNSEIITTLGNPISRSTGNFERIGNTPSWVSNGSSSILGHRQYVYFNELSNEMAVSILTYCDNINTIYENDDSISETFVRTLEIRLKRGIYDHEYNIADFSNSHKNIYNYPWVRYPYEKRYITLL